VSPSQSATIPLETGTPTATGSSNPPASTGGSGKLSEGSEIATILGALFGSVGVVTTLVKYLRRRSKKRKARQENVTELDGGVHRNNGGRQQVQGGWNEPEGVYLLGGGDGPLQPEGTVAETALGMMDR